MTSVYLGDTVAAFRLGPKRDTSPLDVPDQITDHVTRHVLPLLGGSFRSGIVVGVRLLHGLGDDRALLLMSMVAGWSNRTEAAVEALAEHVTVDRLGILVPVDPAPDPGTAPAGSRDLGVDVRLFDLHPGPGSGADDVAKAVATHLAPLVGASPTRAGNVLNVSLLREPHTDRHLLLFGVDIGTSPRNRARFAAVRETATVDELGSFVQEPLGG